MSATPLDMRRKPVVAIDGPAGVGKGASSKAVASELHVPYLDTGSIYRAVTWACLAAGVSIDDELACTRIAQDVHLVFNGGSVFKVDGIIVKKLIREPRITASVSAVSAHAGVRDALMNLQRDAVKLSGGVVEGRDIGVTVLPFALAKIYLTASVEVRAERRFKQLAEPSTTIDDVIADLKRRDDLDSSRAVSPLTIADDAVVVDNGDLSLSETTAVIVDIVNERLNAI